MTQTIVYIIFLCIVFFFTNIVAELYNNKKIIDALKTEEFKSLNQYLLASRFLLNKIDRIKDQREGVLENMCLLLSLIKFHNARCQDVECFCLHTDSLLWVLKRAQGVMSENFIDIYQDELHFLNHYNLSRFYRPISTSQDIPLLTNQFINKERIVLNLAQNINRFSSRNASDMQFADSEDQYFNSAKLDIQRNLRINAPSYGPLIPQEPFDSSLNIAEIIKDQDYTEQDKLEQSPLFRVDLSKMIQSYLAEYVNMLLKQACVKYPKSSLLQLTYHFFQAFYSRNIFLMINQMRLFDPKVLSSLDCISYRVNEAYIIYKILGVIPKKKAYENGFKFKQYGVVFDDSHILKGQYKNGQIPDLMGEETLDHEHFLKVNSLSQCFYSVIQQLNFDVLDFWRTLYNQGEDLDVPKIQSMSESVSQSIKKTQKYFNKITQLSKYADHQLYSIYAIIHKYILNDNAQHDLYMNKMKSLITMQKLFKSNSMKFYADTDLGVILGSTCQKDFGMILHANQYILKALGYMPSEIKNQKIGIIQPRLIRDHHEQFIKVFLSTGESNIMHSLSNLFAINKAGYAIPIQVYAAFHYSIHYTHTMIVFITPIVEMPLQRNGVKFQTKDLMFFLCDSVGNINEVSESCKDIIGFQTKYLTNNDLRTEADRVKIHDLFPELSIAKMRETLNEEQQLKPQIFELQFDINLDIVSQLKSSEKNAIEKLRQAKSLALVIQERYGQGVVDGYVIVIKVIQELRPQNHRLRALDSAYEMDPDVGFEMQNSEDAVPDESVNIQDDIQSASSSDSYTNVESDFIKQSISGLGKQTPRSLKIITQLTLLIFLVMIAISCVNLFLLLDRTKQLNVELNCYKEAAQRESSNGRIRVIVRTISMMANDYEKNTFQFTQGGKYQKLKERLYELTSEIKQIQQNLDQSSFIYSSSFRAYLNSQVVQLRALNSNNQIDISNQTLSFAINLYTNRLLDFYNLNYTDHVSKLPNQVLNSNVSKNYTPTNSERIFYYINQNGLDAIRYHLVQARDKYATDIKDHASESKYSTTITIVVSICSILLVGLVVTPLLARIFDRQFIAINFFLNLSPELMHSLIFKCYQCMIELNELVSLKSKNQIKISKETTLKIKNNLGQHRSRSHALPNETSQSGGPEDLSSSAKYDIHKDRHFASISDFNESVGERTRPHQAQSALLQLQNFDQFALREQKRESRVKFDEDFIIRKETKISSNNKRAQNLQDIVIEEVDMQLEDQDSPKWNQKFKTVQHRHNRRELHQARSHYQSEKFTRGHHEESMLSLSQIDFESQISQTVDVTRTQNDRKTENQLNSYQDQSQKTVAAEGKRETLVIPPAQKINYEEQLENKQKVIKQQQFRLRIRIFISCIVSVIIFSSYFVASYFMAIRVFDEIPLTVDALSIIYGRGTNTFSYMSFYKENLIRNLSYPLYEIPSQSALTYQLSRRAATFTRYTNMRKDLPNNLKSISDFISALEGPMACNITYEDAETRKICSQASNGILQQGFSHTLTYLANVVQADDIRFTSSNRTLAWLRDAINDTLFLDLCETLEFLMINMSQLYKQKATESTISFYDGLVRDYLILFSCFVFILFFIICLFIFNSYSKIKQHMFRTNMSLRILPLDKLNHDQVQNLKEFFK